MTNKGLKFTNIHFQYLITLSIFLSLTHWPRRVSIDSSGKIFAHLATGEKVDRKEGGEGGREGGRKRVHGADRTGCTCRCIGGGGQTGIRAVAPAHLPHPLVAGRRITVPPLAARLSRPSVFSPAFFSPIGRPFCQPAMRRSRTGLAWAFCFRVVFYTSCLLLPDSRFEPCVRNTRLIVIHIASAGGKNLVRLWRNYMLSAHRQSAFKPLGIIVLNATIRTTWTIVSAITGSI